MDSNEIYHHGILNQKWGVRRYQNPDGSLTEAGRKRYSKGIRGYIKRKEENALLNANVARNRLKKESDKTFENWQKLDKDYEKLDSEWAKLDDKAEHLADKATRAKEKDQARMWDEAGKAQKEADDMWDRVSKQLDLADQEWDKVYKLSNDIDSLDKAYEKAAKRYAEKYGQKELDRLPTTDEQIIEQWVDDSVELISGNMTKKQFNNKYKGTGFKAS